MVTTDTTQLNRECNTWRDQLRSFRNELGQLRDQLQVAARDQSDKELLTEVEHFHNQFYIQQINIHDLKQAIKSHDRKLNFETTMSGPSETIISEHENLHEQFHNLEQTIHELRNDFGYFMGRS